MLEKAISLLIGYLCGCFLTAEFTAKKYAGKRVSEIGGSGNPGMANIMTELGFVPGIITLAGDLGKTVIAGLVSYALFRETGWVVVLYAGLGCTIGHDFPFWRRFRGGKGVATTSMAIVLYGFFPGLAANIAGMLTVFATKYLCIGGVVIPSCFMLLMLLQRKWEAAVLAGVLTALAVLAHHRAIAGIPKGQTEKTDVLAAVRKKKEG